MIEKHMYIVKFNYNQHAYTRFSNIKLYIAAACMLITLLERPFLLVVVSNLASTTRGLHTGHVINCMLKEMMSRGNTTFYFEQAK